MVSVCSTCGEQNALDAPFCSSCGYYLGWQGHATEAGPLVGATDGSDGVSLTRESHGVPPPRTPDAYAEQDAFEAGIDIHEATMAIEGAPTTVVINLANRSNLVDSYVVDALEAPPWLEIRPSTAELLPSTSGTIGAEMRIVSRRLVPAQTFSLMFRVSNTTGRSTHCDLPVVVTVPVVTAPLKLRVEPQQLRVRDSVPGVCRVVVSNSGSNRWAQVRLTATDPEQVVRATWSAPQIQIPPGGEATTEVRFEAPLPEPGGDVTRAITVVAREGHRRAETGVALTQSASQAAIDTIVLRLDPSVLRLGGRRRGRITAVVDNRRGAVAVGLSLSGRDPEKRLRFAFSPSTLRVEPGGEASVLVKVTAPRTPSGQEVIRPLTIAATDGHTETRAEGNVIQQASSWRGVARIFLVILGGLLIFLGCTRTFVADTDYSGFQLTAAQIASQVNSAYPQLIIPDQLNARGVGNVVSVGLILIILAGFMLFGLTGRSGRLTRVAAMTGLVVVVGTVVGSTALANGSGPGPGAVVAGVGYVLGYVGGLLSRR